MAYTTIDNPELYFQAKLYTGTGSSASITLDGDEDMQPDLVWIKKRNAAVGHRVYDAVRGVQNTLYTHDPATEATGQSTTLTAFNSDGFTVISESGVNASSDTYVAWCWKESATAGFDIVGYTGNATDDVDISHSLSAVPHVIIVKNRDNANNENWNVYHHKNTSAPETDYLHLNLTNATADNDEWWSDEVPTSSVFTIGRQDTVNTSSGNHIAYLWSEKQGFSKFGSYTGNGDADGPFIYTGFRPAFLIYKCVDQVDHWEMHDNKRDTVNPMDTLLYPNRDAAESDPASTTDRLDFLSNGFKMRTGSSDYNGSGNDYIYIAFAEAPFVNSNGVPNNAR
jgi:hypothetical protein